MATISNFKSVLGGAGRPSQFRAEIVFPTALNLGDHNQASQFAVFMIYATDLPGSHVERMTIPYMGRNTHIAGNRVFTPWSVQIYNTADFSIRKVLEIWSAAISNHSQIGGENDPSRYSVDMKVSQLDRNDVILRTYTLVNCFPMNIDSIKLNFGDVSSIETFGVEFSMDYWTVDSGDAQIK